MAAAPEPEPAALEAPRRWRCFRRDAVLLMRQAPARCSSTGSSAPKAGGARKQRWPDGQAVVRIVGWRPSWDGAERIDHDLVIPEDSGSASIDSLGRRARGVGRSSAGAAAGVVDLFAIAHELGAGATASAYELVWSPPGHGREAAKLSATTTRALAHWGLGPGAESKKFFATGAAVVADRRAWRAGPGSCHWD